MNSFASYASVALDLAVDKALDYSIPEAILDQVTPGARVEVPVRRSFVTGYVIALKEQPEFRPVKPISKVISPGNLIPADLFELGLWMARYYSTPLRHIFKLLLPSSVRSDTKAKEQLFVRRAKPKEVLQKLCVEIRNRYPAQADVLDVMLQISKGILLTELLEETQGSRSPVEALVKKGYLYLDKIRPDRSPLENEEYIQTKPKTLNSAQATSLQQIRNTIEQKSFTTHLLHGVTGSGKTEIYLQAIETSLAMSRGVILLVPEIALTSQTMDRLRSRFKERIAVLHYRLSQGERCDEWHKIHRGEAQIVVGARSAIFSPVPNLGLIIVDEEHENSYKQGDEMPCYHARDVAVMRGKINQCAVVLGSATPSLESYYNVQKGKYKLHTLPARADAATMPKTALVDMRNEYEKAGGYTHFSQALLNGIKQRQEIGEQTILFLNRRGYHTGLLCQACGQGVRCKHCDITLTYHLGDNSLHCHLCGFSLIPPPNACPKCHAQPMRYRGAGTEQIERALHAVIPEIRTIRLDADTTKHKGSQQKLLRAFATGKADVLIGTQMIAKGLHFPQVTLVGVLNNDASLNIPDFRASETVFQLLTQVAGRSGRGSQQGEAIFQTCMPENPVLRLAAAQDYESFYKEELESRQQFGYPPVMQMAKVSFKGENLAKTQQSAQEMHNLVLKNIPSEYEVYPVIPAGYARVKGQHRLQFLIRGPLIGAITRVLTNIQAEWSPLQGVKMRLDINPISTYF